MAKRGRPERPLAPDAPYASLAQPLRTLRSASGFTYHQLSRLTGLTPARLSAIASGHSLPGLDETLAFVVGCGTPLEECETWTRRWHAAQGAEARRRQAADAGQMEPCRVSTHQDLVAALRSVLHLTNLSYGQLKVASGGQLPKSTVSDMLAGRTLPTWQTISNFLATCGEGGLPRDEWHGAWLRARDESAGQVLPPRQRRTAVVDCDPHELGVHRALTGVDDSALTTYVPRDIDSALTSAVAAGRASNTLVILVGPSGAGKTRSAHKALWHEVPRYGVIRPVRSAELESPIPPRTVVWLDDLACLLEESHAARALLTILRGPGPVILIGTLLPDQYQRYVALPGPGAMDRYARHRQLLAEANVIDVRHSLSVNERADAQLAAENDQVVAAALTASDCGPFQLIAAAPHLVRRWRSPADPFGRALISAAVDARRRGVSSALSTEGLRSSALAFLTPAQRAQAPPGWFEGALAYATAKLPGGVAALTTVGLRRETGQPYGYIAADYLVLHGGPLDD